MQSTFHCPRCGAIVYTSRVALHRMWRIGVPLVAASLWHRGTACPVAWRPRRRRTIALGEVSPAHRARLETEDAQRPPG